VTVSAAKLLQSITAPTAITGVANGTAKTANALGLPSTVIMVTNGGNVNAAVTWDLWAVPFTSYNVDTKTEQTFTVNGTVTLPVGVVNTNNVAMTTSISVTVNAAGKVDECFIATAAFGSKLQPAVVLLRQFRDRCLLTNTLGRNFVKFYYHNSPPIAAYIAQSEPLKALVRVLLLPLIAIAYAMLHPGLLGLVACLIFFMVLYRRKVRNRIVA
ncbi:MAG: Ig-like domain-containing protein, partial [Oscillospiraceae bacterium]